MKHYLSSLCLALVSFFYVNEAAADLLLKQNPTPQEPVLYSVSGESYQIAKVTWLPDYLGNNKSHGGGRIDNGGKGSTGRRCETYGYVKNCPSGSVGTKVSPIPELVCYKNCKSCSDFGLSDRCGDKNILAPGASVRHPLPGLNCYNRQVDCKCPPEYKYQSGQYTCTLKGDVCYTTYTSAGIKSLYTECTCGSQYKYLSEPNAVGLTGSHSVTNCFSPAKVGGSTCTFQSTSSYFNEEKGGRVNKITLYTDCTCPEGYTLQNGTCVSNCTGYPLTTCPMGGICSKCPENNAKLKLDSCDTSKGWEKGLARNTCSAKACPAGYTAGVSTCRSDTKPDYSQNGWAGGLPCGLCKCNNINSNCTAANYPLTTLPANANYESCTTGCGSERVTRYKITSCKTSYTLTDGVCKYDVCVSGYSKTACTSTQKQIASETTAAGTICYKCGALACSDYNTTYKTSVSENELCRKITVGGLTCYGNCLQGCRATGYSDSDNVLYDNSRKKIGIYDSGSFYCTIKHPYSDSTNKNATIDYNTAKDYCTKNGYAFPSANMADVIRSSGIQALWTSTSRKTGTHYGCAFTHACTDLSDTTKLTQSVCVSALCECPSGSALEGQCGSFYTQDKSTVVKELSDGRKCYKCNYGSGTGTGTDYGDLSFSFEVFPYYGTSVGRFDALTLYVEFRTLGGEKLSSAEVTIPSGTTNDTAHLISAPFDKKIPNRTTIRAYIQERWNNAGGSHNGGMNRITINGQTVSSVPSSPGSTKDVTIEISNSRETKVHVDYCFGGACG